MIKCIIIDDEQHSIELIKSFCKKIPYMEVIGEFNDPILAAPFVESNEIDVVFLDINMQTMSGMDFMKFYQVQNVILITAYSEYALESYEYAVIDYLLKPIPFERFLAATQKVLNKKRKAIAQAATTPKETPQFCYIKTDRDKLIRISFREIKYIQGLKNYISIHTTQDKVITLLNMKSMEEKLPGSSFIRVHKSYIVNMEYFESIESNQLRLAGIEDAIPLGKTYRDAFLSNLGKNIIK